jgi:uncharacterized protein YcfL
MKRSLIRSSWAWIPVLALVLAVSSVTWVGCGSETEESVTRPSLDNTALQFGPGNPAIRAVMEVQDRATPDLMAIDGVVGTATGVDVAGTPVIKVYTERRLPRGLIPASIEGVPVQVEVSGRIVAMKGKPGGKTKVDHKAKQTPPIQLGTSGGWRYDLANGYCCGGTLGCLIQVGGQQRILSNYHVFESDIVNGGNGRVAQTGDPIIQPGLIDVGCDANQAQNVATLVVTQSLPGSNVDASTATVIDGMVDPSGAILEIGVLSSQTVAAYVGQKVKKSGRTTGLSRSSVDGLNATVSVSYDNECAGGSAFTKTFTGQVIVKNRGSKFLAGGDSGSLMVEDVDTNPRAVGLLFAGSSTLAVANPIDEVLAFFNASMVGN